MKESVENIRQRLSTYKTVSWAELPDLELYMDQVVTYTQKQLELFQSAQTEKLATPAILSNNVKSGLIHRPNKKKYGKGHLSAFLMVCALKQIFPIQQVEQLLRAGGENETEAFEVFGRLQDEALKETAKSIATAGWNKQALSNQILRLALTANANRLAARMLLEQLAETETQEAKNVHKGEAPA